MHPPPTPPGDRPPTPTPSDLGPFQVEPTDALTTVFDALRMAGAAAGRSAADWWAQDTVGGRAAGDVTATARHVLAGIDDGDPQVLDSLPTAGLTDPVTDHACYTDAAPPNAPGWDDLSTEHRYQAIDAYRDGFDTAVEARITEHCRVTLKAAATGVSATWLYPDELRIGDVGVFAGDWAWTADRDGGQRVPVGFVGVLVDWWNWWALFVCTREVAEAIVADQQRQRDRYCDELLARGVTGDELTGQVDQRLARLTFTDDHIVVDERGVSGDSHAVHAIEPDAQGRFVVMGGAWTWTAVHPTDCDRIVGTLPDPGTRSDS